MINDDVIQRYYNHIIYKPDVAIKVKLMMT